MDYIGNYKVSTLCNHIQYWKLILLKTLIHLYRQSSRTFLLILLQHVIWQTGATDEKCALSDGMNGIISSLKYTYEACVAYASNLIQISQIDLDLAP